VERAKHKFLKAWGHALGQESLKDFAAPPPYRTPLALPESLPHPAPPRRAAPLPTVNSTDPPPLPGDLPPTTSWRGVPDLPPPNTLHYAVADSNPKEVKDKSTLLGGSPDDDDDVSSVCSGASAADALGLHGRLGPAIAEAPVPKPLVQTVTVAPVTEEHSLAMDVWGDGEIEEEEDDSTLVKGPVEPEAPHDVVGIRLPPPPPVGRSTGRPKGPKLFGWPKGRHALKDGDR